MKRLLASVAIAAMLCSPAMAQQGGMILPPDSGFIGMLSAQGKAPVGTGCTVAAGSTDSDGTCTATAASGSLVFAKTNIANAPFCILSDSSATPIAVYTVTALQITFTTLTSTHVYRWHCVEQAGL